MSAALTAVLAGLGNLPHAELTQVIDQARDLRAKAWLKRLAELVTVPVTVSAGCSYESSDEGGTIESWSGTYEAKDGTSFDDGELQDGVYDEDRESAVHAVFGANAGRSEEEVHAAMTEFGDLSLAYARWSAEGEPEVSFTIQPGG